MFYLNQKYDLAVAQLPRCGLNTIRAWLGHGTIVVENNDSRLSKVARRVAFIRNPLERLKSAFSLFYWLLDYHGKPHISGAPVSSWEAFVDFVLDPEIPDDEHWLSQKQHIGNIANIYHRFENIAQVFESYRPGVLPHMGRTSRRPTTDYRISELIEKYKDDLNLWKGIVD